MIRINFLLGPFSTLCLFWSWSSFSGPPLVQIFDDNESVYFSLTDNHAIVCLNESFGAEHQFSLRSDYSPLPFQKYQ